MRSNDSTPARRLIAAPSSDPSMDEALARVRRIEALDEDTRRAASYVRTARKVVA
ncbi:hypothetical protein [Streptomyces sp. NPDC001194]|uniref:hypothetical protein n=1 Tax=Streptomyces sp. NPDC001194 TaxID=3364547 RepID=UPI00369ACD03